METVHIRLEHDEALFTKKELLSSEIETLELLKKFKQYKALRQKELIVQNQFKKLLSDLKKQVSDLQSSFPKQSEHEAQLKILEEVKNKKIPPPVPVPKQATKGVDIKKEEKVVKEPAKVSKAVSEKAKVVMKKKQDYEVIESQLNNIKAQLAGLG